MSCSTAKYERGSLWRHTDNFMPGTMCSRTAKHKANHKQQHSHSKAGQEMGKSQSIQVLKQANMLAAQHGSESWWYLGLA